jgi:hypothetical protein
VQLENGGWYRIGRRGNKPNVNAAFCPPLEPLAFPLECDDEHDIGSLHSKPLPEIIEAMQAQETVQELYSNLPDTK